MNKYVRKDLRQFKPYHAPSLDYDIKIDANENPYNHSQKVMNKVKKWLDQKDHITRYPDTDSNELRQKIAKVYGVHQDQVICTVGSDQLIDSILRVFIEPGDTILVPDPSFSMYGLYNTLSHGKTITYTLNDDFSYPVDEIIKLYKKKQPKVVFICTPNNPTGSTISTDDIKKLLDVIKCPVVVDEAYAEFIDESMISYIDQYSQLIVLRTFSKAYGLAGLRVGYGIANKEMMDYIRIAKPPYNLSSFSQALAGFILDDLQHYKDISEVLKINRDKLVEALKKIDAIQKIYPSKANFILVKVKDIDVAQWLYQHKILVRSYQDEGRLANCIRITVGNQDENKKLIKVLQQYDQDHK